MQTLLIDTNGPLYIEDGEAIGKFLTIADKIFRCSAKWDTHEITPTIDKAGNIQGIEFKFAPLVDKIPEPLAILQKENEENAQRWLKSYNEANDLKRKIKALEEELTRIKGAVNDNTIQS